MLNSFRDSERLVPAHQRIAAFVFGLWLGALPVQTHAGLDKESPNSVANELRVAVLAYRGTERAHRRWQSTMTYLSKEVLEYRFSAIPMTLVELDRAVVEGTVDFAITNAGQYVRVGSKNGMSGLATLKSPRREGNGPVIGSTMIVRAGADYQTLEDLKHTRLGAVDPLAFGGFQIYWGELARQGIRPNRYFSEIKFSGFPVDALAYWVRDGFVDAAVVPVCLLEDMGDEGLINLEDFRFIGKKSVEGFDCHTSTMLYPNWTFSTLRATPSAIADRVAEALLILPTDSEAAVNAGSLGWTAPVSSYDIHQLYELLNIHPWQKPWWLEMRAWLLQNSMWGLFFGFVMGVGLFHHIWVQLMVRKRTRELQAMNEELMHQQQQLEHAQRVAILGELSSDLAHELNQPLAAINSFAEGGAIRLQASSSMPDMPTLLKKISKEAQRGGRIIERIRDFARNANTNRQRLDLNAMIRETAALLDYELKKHTVGITLELQPDPLMFNADPVGVQQLLVNLMRNGMEAMAEQSSPKQLVIRAQPTEPEGVVISVEDTGAGIDPATVEDLFKPFHSTKQGGLGLGLAICRRIVEAHNGRMEMTLAPSGGTLVRCTLTGAQDA